MDVCSVDVGEVELSRRGDVSLIFVYHQVRMAYVDCVPSPPLHLLFCVSEELYAGAIDNGAKREVK